MAKIILNEKNIADYMKRNKCSREEAIELINYDNAIDSAADIYLDVVNLFIRILSITGKRRS